MGDKQRQRARDILRRPYSRVLIKQEEGGYTAEILEFPGCFAEGETADEANANLERVAESWILAAWDSETAIPEPLEDYQGTGKFALRMPRSIYGRAAKAAVRDRISLNQYICLAVAEKLGASASSGTKWVIIPTRAIEPWTPMAGEVPWASPTFTIKNEIQMLSGGSARTGGSV